MKKGRKIIGWLFLLLIAGAIGFFAWIWFSPMNMRNVYDFVPEKTVYMIESAHPIGDWAKFSASPIWRHLKKNDYMKEIGENADYLDSLINAEKQVLALLNNKKLVIAAHMIAPDNYDFLFLVDLKKAAKVSFFMDIFNVVLNKMDYIVEKTTIKETEVYSIRTGPKEDPVYLTFVDNILVCSYSTQLIGLALEEYRQPHVSVNERFNLVHDGTPEKGVGRLFMNMAMLDEFMKVYMDPVSETVISLSNQLEFGGLDIDMGPGKSYGELTGTLLPNDSTPSMLSGLYQTGSMEIDVWEFDDRGKKLGKKKKTFDLNLKPSAVQSHEVLPANTSFLLNLNFHSAKNFYGRMMAIYSQDQKEYEDLLSMKDRAEKYLKISLEEHFISWMDDEIAVTMMPLDQEKQRQAYLAFFKANDAGEAQRNLDYVAERIRKKTPVKFKEYEHHGVRVNYLEMKGFFKIFIGKLFNKFEHPHFIQLGEYVVFASDTAALHRVIEASETGNTLAKQPGFTKLFDRFDSKSNYFIYLNGAELFPWVPTLAEIETRRSMKANAQYITCFTHWGLQLTENDGAYDARVYLEFEKPK